MFVSVSIHLKVRILSDCWSPDTTSDVAAGIFLWGPPAPDAGTDAQWAGDSWRWYSDLLARHEPEQTGVSSLSCLLLSQHRQDMVERRHMDTLAPVYRSGHSQSVLKRLTSCFISQKLYREGTQSRSSRGKIQIRKIFTNYAD